MSPADLAFGLLAVSRVYFPAASCLALPASNHSSVTAEYVWCFSSATRLSAFTRAGGSMHMNLTCPVGFRGIEPSLPDTRNKIQDSDSGYRLLKFIESSSLLKYIQGRGVNMAITVFVPLKSISFSWGVPHTTFASWADAEAAILTIIARATDPVRVGYRIEWTDGETFTAHLDVTASMTGPPFHLEAHVRRSLALTAGRFRPPTMSREAQRDFLADQEAAEPGKAFHARALLDKHAIGGAS